MKLLFSHIAIYEADRDCEFVHRVVAAEVAVLVDSRCADEW